MRRTLGIKNSLRKYLIIGLTLLSAVAGLSATEHRGQVIFNGLGVPGAVVTASRSELKQVAITDAKGDYLFPDLQDGEWDIQVDMQAFSPIQRKMTIGSGAPTEKWELRLLPIEQIQGLQTPPPPATTQPQPPSATDQKDAKAAKSAGKKGTQTAPTNTQTPFQRTDVNATGAMPAPQPGLSDMSEAPPSNEAFGNQNPADLSQRAADGFLISGTANNSASSPTSLKLAFGNNRRGIQSVYNGNIGFIIDNSALDARTYSLSGANTEKPAYNHMQGTFSFGGPLRIPHLVRNGPTFYVGYQVTRNRNVQTQSGLVPTLAERNGDLSQAPGQIYDPAANLPFAGNQIPLDRISPQARSLLKLYPLPNFTGSAQYNYQIPVVGAMHLDSVFGYMSKTIGGLLKNQISGTYSFYSTRSDNPTLLAFLDTSRSIGSNLSANWRHSFAQRFFTTFGYKFNHQSSRTVAFFENRENISGLAGITGNNQEAINWGPPTLGFMSGITSLSDGLPSSTHNQTNELSIDNTWSRGKHILSFGANYRRLQLNVVSQQDPRGSFTFTGTSTLERSSSVPLPGSRNDFAGFLLGIPDTARIAFGNADKYFRASTYSAYIADDWRLNSNLTLNIGLRWEYSSPVTELYGRLVNLDIASNFLAVAPVVANDPTGSITGAHYPNSLLDPDKHAFQPRIGFSWRPMAGSSMVVRGGYGIYYNNSPYQSIASRMAQQSPLSKSLSLQNSAANPLTLANGFTAPPNTTTNTFAVDPKLRIGYVHLWQLSIQQDLPLALQLTAAYQGSKGTHALQEFLPNTYPSGAVRIAVVLPSGFTYLTSNGTSTREAGTLQLRRRLHNGFTATMEYTFSKSIDNASPGESQPGSAFIAQNWQDLEAERALSSFDRRHQASFVIQYTSGMGVGGGTLVKGWKGALLKEWTISSEIRASSGSPLTPVYPSAVVGTGVTGPVRPDYTGADIYTAPPGLHLNPAAYTAPATGHWGNAGRNTITGPSQFSLNASLARTFRTSDRTNLDLRVEAANALNHVTFPSWNTTVGSTLFGLPMMANSMRTVQTTIRFKF
jgi:trimeric autotransporter adhesin